MTATDALTGTVPVDVTVSTPVFADTLAAFGERVRRSAMAEAEVALLRAVDGAATGPVDDDDLLTVGEVRRILAGLAGPTVSLIKGETP